jgi:hypothetical protein
LSFALLDEFYGEGILKIFPFIGSDGGQDGIHNVHQSQSHLDYPTDACRPKQPSKPKVITVYMDV